MDPGSNLRDVLTYNPLIISDIPHYHLSMACNHCLEPPCEEQCPAKAIRKDPESGIVIIDDTLCIGCTYCSWVCPYGAPEFDISEGIMKKCDLCHERISSGFRPACETVCPTGALQTQLIDPETVEQKVPFFPETGISPAISIEKPGRPSASKQQYINTYPEEILKSYSSGPDVKVVDVSLKREWTLFMFTLLISVLGAVFGGNFLAGKNIDPVIFGVSAISGIVISLIHLGKKSRSFRIIRNFSNSWISRESVFFALFLSFSFLSLSGKLNPFSGIAGMITIYLTAFSADMIYSRSAGARMELFHSAQITLTLSFFLCYITGFITGFIILSVIKVSLYLRRKVSYGFGSSIQILLTLFRIIAGLAIPSVLILLTGAGGIIIPILLLAGEMTDRGEFYYEFDILSPRDVMNNYFNRELLK
ncbi:MAG: dimethyl sulfoxide reductase anchor subunit [Candidatus Aminicenantes bacterium]|nr:dimethyl sulfoxide reductase anchor subunit [Candidatus Aminicenantes bacterium]MCK5004466.1 dimethyl sulfoxide reductase anchor subunit [Candidatus Aminicenantes bacterium]